MKVKASILLLLISCLLLSCGQPEKTKTYENPSTEGFDLAYSDPAAVELADSVMSAMGGRKNWDKTRFISWNSGDGRNLFWDKELNRVRIESLEDSTTYLLNTKTLEGKVQIKGQTLTIPDSLNKMLSDAKGMWISDSYWLVMPFNLKDNGVTLKYLGEDTLQAGGLCNVLELTYSNTGDKPQNKYEVFVDIKDNLIKQWAYYGNAEKETAEWIKPWDNYQTYGNILLSADRSDGAGPKNVKVEKLDDKIFLEF
ncbi:MAG TPA: hypothetical protein PLJ60_00345 [Chryseolinea sp.]|nr:hypothetical protein [Chryseolinea sp.]HPH45422.1 hypothetical protein [Chryseolinea sp.]HPM28755.1 hypothetical protein [Chryseolinea sp.]